MTREEAVALLERYSNYDGMGIPNLAGCKEAMRVAVDALKEACPELRESEDERVRKELLEYAKGEVRSYDNMVSGDYDSRDKEDKMMHKWWQKIVAYLEKQKECLADNSKTSESEDEIREELIGALMWQRDCLDAKGPHDNNLILPGFTMKVGDILEWLEKQKEKKEIPLMDGDADLYFDNWIQHNNATKRECFEAGITYLYRLLNKQKEQKPAEWSDNFEENIRELLHDKLTWHSEDGSMSSTVFIDDKTLKDIINGIWFYVGKEALKYPSKELNVTEWSEEDERMLNQLIYDVENHKKEGLISAKQNKATKTLYNGIEKCYDEKIAWLKSLRSSWKPNLPRYYGD